MLVTVSEPLVQRPISVQRNKERMQRVTSEIRYYAVSEMIYEENQLLGGLGLW